jgi:hypothetical protein
MGTEGRTSSTTAHTECGIRLHGQLGIHSFVHSHESMRQKFIQPFNQSGIPPVTRAVSQSTIQSVNPVSHYQSPNKDKWPYLYKYNSPDCELMLNLNI